MTRAQIIEGLFFAIVIVLVGLILGLNCLQGAGVKLLGLLECNYSFTSADFRVKVTATALLVLFIALIFGPILAVLRRPRGLRRSRRFA